MKKTSVPALLSAFLLASCANVTFHPSVPDGTGTAPDLSKQTGLKYYTAKPYLLIAPTGNKDAPLKAEIISLPDLEHPTYAIYHPGWGQHIFSLAVSSNGSLSSYGQTADSKIPETIAAVGSLMSGASVLKAAFARSNPNEPIQKAIKQLAELQKLNAGEDLIVKQKIAAALNVKARLEQMMGNYTEDDLAAVSKDLDKLKFKTPQGPTQSDVNEVLDGAKGNVDEAIEALKPASSKKARLYEIKMTGGQTKLIEVPLPPEK
jgi:hypothetical protein